MLAWVPVIALSAFLPRAIGQTTNGTVDLFYQSVDQTYVVNLSDGGNQTGNGYAAAQDLSFTNLNSSSLALPSSSLYLFCVELGEDSPGGANTPNSPELYQIFDVNSIGYANSTSIPGTPNLMANVHPIEASAGITASGGIGSYRATQLQLLYGYAFGAANGVLSQGYNPTSLTAAQQVAFQLAVWKLAYEGSSGSPASLYVTPGGGPIPGLSVTGVDGLLSSANSLLTGVSNDVGITPMALYGLNNGTYQDYLIPTNSFTQVPEPSTYGAVLGILTLGFVILRGRRAKED